MAKVALGYIAGLFVLARLPKVHPMIGRVFLNRYEVQRLLGEGGMGRVYLAKQQDLGRQVVVKVMHDHVSQDPKFRERFQRETLLMARFLHPYAVTLYDASLNDPVGPCIVMEYVKGGNLETLLGKVKKMSAPRVIRILTQLCDVLQAAHDEGMIHRDLKPANLMVVDPDTPKERIKVMDFGLAKLVEDTPTQRVTDTSVDFAVGTPAYICPEQVRGEQMDHRGDLYSVGIMAYELLTGRVPFQGNSGMDVLLAHATERPPSFAEIGLKGWVPQPIEEVVMQTLEKDPDNRPQSAKELADLLKGALRKVKLVSESEWKRQSGLPALDPESDTNPEEEALILVPAKPPSSAMRPAPEAKSATSWHKQQTHNLIPIAEEEVGKGDWKREQVGLPFDMDAWMPEAIALMKLRGFVQDNGAKFLECSSKRVLIRMNGTKAYSAVGWLGLSSRASGPLDVELKLVKVDPKRENQIKILVLFTPSHPSLLSDKNWTNRCSTVFVQLRAYLMGGSST